ncbi:TcdA/TcdB catalytic glycosyltransferase domain-containing protein [Leclercia sp. S52]|uniref:TcdA/TcdB catalytic glycosyltransferase domain-containing protein n=1 Tax=Leclercia sp. S52 TaxID=3138178 RepID=UPI00321B7D47
MIDDILSSKIMHLQKVQVPDVINFIWIGDINHLNHNYINLWAETNIDKDINLWCDDSTGNCALLHDAIRHYVQVNVSHDQFEAEKNIRNSTFYFIFNKLKEGFLFGDSVIDFLRENNIPYNKNQRESMFPNFQNANVKYKSISNIFTGGFSGFMKYYYYELILRGNLASASDIARLVIIYRYGGVYIDVDVLPNTHSVFKKFNNFMAREKYIESDNISLFKTISLLNKMSLIDFGQDKILDHAQGIAGLEWQQDDRIYSLIESDVAAFHIEDILPLGKIYVYKNLLSLGTDKRLKGIYLNCFIASHPQSKVVKIVLRTMAKRYAFLENNNSIFDFYTGKNDYCYLARLLPWRSELITKDYCVTSILTGPGLIVEVLLGLAYSLFKIDDAVSPSYISELMQDDRLGIAFSNLNLDTPEALRSTWRQ